MILVFLIFSGGLLYTFNQTKTYKAVGSIRLLDGMPTSRIRIDDLLPKSELLLKPIEVTTLTDQESEIQTEIELFTSQSLGRLVERRLSDDLHKRFITPYQSSALLTPLTIHEILMANRKIERIGDSTLLEVSYIHPDPMIAAHVAMLFMEEYINDQLTREIDAYMVLVESLLIRVESLNKQISRYEQKLSQLKLKEANGAETQSLDLALKQSIQMCGMLNRAIEEGKLRITMTEAYAEVIDKPYPPLYHYKANVIRNLSTSLSASLFVAFMFLRLTRQRDKDNFYAIQTGLRES